MHLHGMQDRPARCGRWRPNERTPVPQEDVIRARAPAWLALGYGEWILPGQTVTDPDNWGKPPVVWVYNCTTEDGARVLVGGLLEAR